MCLHIGPTDESSSCSLRVAMLHVHMQVKGLPPASAGCQVGLCMDIASQHSS